MGGGTEIAVDIVEQPLGEVLDPPAQVGDASIPVGWRDLNAAYEKRFDIPPEKATPPPL